MAERKTILLFNKLTKAYAGELSSNIETEAINTKYFIWKEEMYDPATHTWEGDYDTGSFIPRVEQKQVISQTVLNARAQDKIFKRYKLSKQHNITTALMEVMLERLNRLCEMNSIEGITEENSPELLAYNEMKYYIEQILLNNERITEAYKNNPAYDYVSLQEEFARRAAIFEGGLYELFPQEHTTDTV